MHKLKKYKAITLLLALILVLGMAAQTTLAYLQAESETVKNTFVPVKRVQHDLEISVTGEKILEGRDWQEGDSFIFILQLWDTDKEAWETKGTQSVAYSKDKQDFNSFDFSSIVKEQLTESRYYTFRILEGEGSLENVTYDTKICKFLINVTADETGAMSIASVTDKENTVITQDSETGYYTAAVKFTNTYVKPPEPPVIPDPDDIKFDVNIQKTVKNEGSESIGPDGFIFQMEKNSTKEQWEKTSDKDGNAVFHMTFTKDDIGKVYIYEVSEVKGQNEDITYDNSIYELKVGIGLDEENNVLVPDITLDGQEVSKVTLKFQNIYAPASQPEPDEPTTDPDEPATEPDEPSDQPTKPGDKPTDGTADKPEDGSGSPDSPDKDKGTQTGDDSSMFLYFALMITSAIIMALLFIGNRKKKLVK